LDGAAALKGEGRAQGLMARDEQVQTLLQGREIEGAPEANSGGDVVERAVGGELVEEPQALLSEGERAGTRIEAARNCPILCARGEVARPAEGSAACVDQRGQLRHAGRLEQGAEGHVGAEGIPQSSHHPHAEQGVAAQVEEVVMDADLGEVEQIAPDLSDESFGRRGWRCEPRHWSPVRNGIGQRRAIDFPGERERQAWEGHEDGGDHIVRQLLPEVGAEVGRGGFSPATGDHVGHQALVTGVALADDHDRVAHERVLPQNRFDFPELDAEAPNLDLVVETAEEVELSVAAVADEVSRPIEARARAAGERIRHESLGAQVRSTAVAARHPRAADVQFAGHAQGSRLTSRVEDVHAGVGERPSDGNGAVPGRHSMRGGPDRRLRWPVQIPDLAGA
jgi:hypothetical protein